MHRVIAIDWSGAKARNGRGSIALAEVRAGRLVRLDAGLDRVEAIQSVLDTDRDGPVLVGLDFAFSVPLWYLQEQGYSSAAALWEALASEGERGAESLLQRCDPPFWGKYGTRRPHAAALDCRRTTREHGAKPVFQVGGAGSVGTGSLRGMPYLRLLKESGWAIWPFDDPGERTVVEIYPRRLYRHAGIASVCKSDDASREQALGEIRGLNIPPKARQAAIGSEHAFDALTAAIGLWKCVGGKRFDFPAADAEARLEGMIFQPE